MKKIASLMLLLLSPVCARAMDAQQPIAATEPAAATLSDSMENIRGFFHGRYLMFLLQQEMEINPDNTAVVELKKEVELKGLDRNDPALWLRAQNVVNYEAKRATMRQACINHIP
jgi:hypothetical protein